MAGVNNGVSGEKERVVKEVDVGMDIGTVVVEV
jgi:hypothetical protein